MAAADFFGTCQICGREQKAHPHKIAKHGYTIRYGWQMGECFGSGAKPYELSNDRILAAIENAKAYIVQTKEKIETLKADPFNADGSVTAKYRRNRYDAPMDAIHGVVRLAVSAKGKIVATTAYSDDEVFPLDLSNAKTVDEAARKLADAEIASLRHSIKETEVAIPYMKERFDKWTLKELKPVSPADRAASKIKVHMAAKMFGKTTGICVASASAADAYKVTTDDRSKVTCAACLKELARRDELPRLKAEKAEKERLKDIKEAERNIKEYQKWIKNSIYAEDTLRWTGLLTEATNRLEALKAQAPAQPAQ